MAEHEWELSKENARPLKQGRCVETLNAALSERRDQDKAYVEAQRAAFSSEIENYVGDDPLAVWLKYIQWTHSVFPTADHASRLVPLLESCTAALSTVERYKNDVRFLRLWIQYAASVPDPMDAFRYMTANGIGLKLALFWEAKAIHLERCRNFREALQTYEDGLSLPGGGVEPKGRLDTLLKEFQARMVRRIQRDQRLADEARANGEEAPKVEDRGARAVLGKRPASAAPMTGRTPLAPRPMAPTGGDGRNGVAAPDSGGIGVYEEEAGGDATAAAPAVPFPSLPTQEAGRRENTLPPQQWNKAATFKQKKTLVQKPAAARESLGVYEDGEGEEEVVAAVEETVVAEDAGEGEATVTLGVPGLDTASKVVSTSAWPSSSPHPLGLVRQGLSSVKPSAAPKSESKAEAFAGMMQGIAQGALATAQAALAEVDETRKVQFDPLTHAQPGSAVAAAPTPLVGASPYVGNVSMQLENKFLGAANTPYQGQHVPANAALRPASPTINTKIAMDDIMDMFQEDVEPGTAMKALASPTNIFGLSGLKSARQVEQYSQVHTASRSRMTEMARTPGPDDATVAFRGPADAIPRGDAAPTEAISFKPSAALYGDAGETDTIVFQPKGSSAIGDAATPAGIAVFEDDAEEEEEVHFAADFFTAAPQEEETTEMVGTEGAGLEVFEDEPEEAAPDVVLTGEKTAPQASEGFRPSASYGMPEDSLNTVEFRAQFVAGQLETINEGRSSTSSGAAVLTPLTAAAEEEAVVPAEEEAVVPAQEESMVPAEEEAVVPAQEEAVVPADEGTPASAAAVVSEEDPLAPDTHSRILAGVDVKSLKGLSQSLEKDLDLGTFTLDAGTSMPTVTLAGGAQFAIKRKLGDGREGVVYAAMPCGSEDGDGTHDDTVFGETGTVALKVATGSVRSLWEFYMLRQLPGRIPPGMWKSCASVTSAHVHGNAVVLAMPCCDLGSLEGAVEAHIEGGDGGSAMDEVLALFYTLELARVLESLHRGGIAHGDVRLANLMVRDSADGVWEVWAPGREGSWANKGIKLIDFGRAIDTRAQGEQFAGPTAADIDEPFRCAALCEGRAWAAWEHDLHGMAAATHHMLFGSPDMRVRHNGKLYESSSDLSALEHAELWTLLFDNMLNPDCTSMAESADTLDSFVGAIESYIEETPALCRKVKTLLMKQNIMLSAS